MMCVSGVGFVFVSTIFELDLNCSMINRKKTNNDLQNTAQKSKLTH